MKKENTKKTDEAQPEETVPTDYSPADPTTKPEEGVNDPNAKTIDPASTEWKGKSKLPANAGRPEQQWQFDKSMPGNPKSKLTADDVNEGDNQSSLSAQNSEEGKSESTSVDADTKTKE